MSLKSLAARKAISTNKVLLIVLCIFIPPLAVWAMKDLGKEFVISIIATLCLGIPGVIYALWLALK